MAITLDAMKKAPGPRHRQAVRTQASSRVEIAHVMRDKKSCTASCFLMTVTVRNRERR